MRLGFGLGNTVAAALAATVLLAGGSHGAVRRLEVRVPEGWETADRVMLLVKGVSLPRNQAVIFELYACDHGGEDVRLGSYGVLAESETASGTRTFEVFRVNVTRPFRRWAEAHPEARTVTVRIEPFDGSGRPIKDLRWSSRQVELTAIPKR